MHMDIIHAEDDGVYEFRVTLSDELSLRSRQCYFNITLDSLPRALRPTQEAEILYYAKGYDQENPQFKDASKSNEGKNVPEDRVYESALVAGAHKTLVE